MKLRAERRLRFRLVFQTCASENTCASVKVDGAAVGREFEVPLPLAIMLGEPAFLAVIVGDMGQRDRRVVGKVLASFAATRGPIMPRDWLAVSWSIWRTNVTTRQRPVTFDWRQ